MGRAIATASGYSMVKAELGTFRGAPAAAAGADLAWLEGDWRCDVCGTLNFGTSTMCFKCHKPSPSKQTQQRQEQQMRRAFNPIDVKDEGSSSSSTARLPKQLFQPSKLESGEEDTGFHAGGAGPTQRASPLDEVAGPSSTAANLADSTLSVERVAACLRHPLLQVEELLRCGAVQEMWRRGCGGVGANVLSTTQDLTYKVLVQRPDPTAKLEASCTCPDFERRGSLCKHGAAVLLSMVPGHPLAQHAGSAARTPHGASVMKADGTDQRAKETPVAAAAEVFSPSLGGPTLQRGVQVKLENPEVPDEIMAPTWSIKRPAPAEPAAAAAAFGEDTWKEVEAAERPPGSLLLGAPLEEHGRSSSSRASTDAPPCKRRKLPASFTDPPPAMPRPGQSSTRGKAAKESGPQTAGDGAVAPVSSAHPKPRAGRGKSGAAAGPQRPRTAYQCYLQDTRATPGANAWKTLSSEERKPYEAAAIADKARYETEMAAAAAAEDASRQQRVDAGDELLDARTRLNARSGMEERVLIGNPFNFAMQEEEGLAPAPADGPLLSRRLPSPPRGVSAGAAELLEPCADPLEVALPREELLPSSPPKAPPGEPAPVTASAPTAAVPFQPRQALTGMEFFDDDSDAEGQNRQLATSVRTSPMRSIGGDANARPTPGCSVGSVAPALMAAGGETSGPTSCAAEELPPTLQASLTAVAPTQVQHRSLPSKNQADWKRQITETAVISAPVSSQEPPPLSKAPAKVSFFDRLKELD
mmetsp:Transcript_76335/g.181523  ORF Transcript_76335/g.181523 Transcript_76335/m.181523 type:complete len:756 (+) Transcript_76335:36-2303(+)